MSNISLLLLSIIGIILCITWFIHIGSYRQLNDAMLEIIKVIEGDLPYSCYTKEWDKIKEKKYIKLTFYGYEKHMKSIENNLKNIIFENRA